MAIPHLSAKVISRGKGHSAGGAMAYRSGEKLIDPETGRVHDYTGLSDRVAYSTILTPENAPEHFSDRQSLCNAVEAVENTHNRRATARLFREVEVALQREMSLDQHIKLVNEFAEENMVSLGMVADISIHTDPENHNPHAHILLTTRDIDEDGFGKKNRDWDKKELVQQWRDAWEVKVNDHLEDANSPERIDMRSLQAQRLDAIGRGEWEIANELNRIPQQHYGKHAWHEMQNASRDKRPIESERAARLQHRTEHYNDVDKFWKASNLSVNEDILLREMQAGYENNQPTLDRTDKFPQIYQVYPEPEQGRGIER